MACLSLPKLLLAGDQVMKCPSSEQAVGWDLMPCLVVGPWGLGPC